MGEKGGGVERETNVAWAKRRVYPNQVDLIENRAVLVHTQTSMMKSHCAGEARGFTFIP